MGAFVQTERLSRSMFFNQLQEGMEVVLLNQPRKSLPPNDDPLNYGELAVISKVPVYPSTWLTAIIKDTGEITKARTSRIALPQGAPAPSNETLLTAIEEARRKTASAKVRVCGACVCLCPGLSLSPLPLSHPCSCPLSARVFLVLSASRSGTCTNLDRHAHTHI